MCGILTVIVGASRNTGMRLHGDGPDTADQMMSLRYFLLVLCVGMLVVAPVFAASPPLVFSASPGSGPTDGSTQVTIIGANLMNAISVNFGTTSSLLFTVNGGGASITAMTPQHAAGRVMITVSTLEGTSPQSCHATFFYQSAPAITGISPASGPTGGGNSVMITGNGFVDTSGVWFGGTPSPSYAANGDGTAITATVPAHSAGPVDVTVGSSSGTSTVSSADHYTFAVIPAVTGISPALGPTAGGTTVTITGTALAGATGVRFGSSASPSFSVSGDGKSITAVSPAHTAGTVDVTVNTLGGTSAVVAGDTFTYGDPPKVTGISPAQGSTSGNKLVVITGSGFSGATAVLFGAPAGTNLTVVSPTRILVRSPAHAAGTVDVRVTAPGGTSAVVAADTFTFVSIPNVTGILPTSGSTAGGSRVTITGTGFTGATAVTFGATAGTNMTVFSSTKINVTSPAHTAGIVNVKVTTPGGTSAISTADRFTYSAPPKVTGISPASGSHAGNTLVTVTGTGFIGATAVTFGTIPGTSRTVVNATTITVRSPAHAAGIVYVRVTTPYGTSALAAGDRFTYT
jgi:hypothetical protein